MKLTSTTCANQPLAEIGELGVVVQVTIGEVRLNSGFEASEGESAEHFGSTGLDRFLARRDESTKTRIQYTNRDYTLLCKEPCCATK